MKKVIFSFLTILFAASCSQTNEPKLLDKTDFQTTVDGKTVSLYTLKAGNLVMQVTNYGVRVVSLWAPDREGNYADVEIGYENIDREDNGEVIKVADVYSPKSGRGMEVYTDQIAMQFYCGNIFDGSYNNKFGKPIAYRGAIALETQRYPDAPNQPSFPSVELKPGEVYKHTCIYKFYAK